MTKHYEELFSWQSFHCDNLLIHQDGSVSAAILWEGMDASIKAVDEVDSLFRGLTAKINNISADVVIEQHLLRDYDNTLTTQYLKLSDEKTVRQHELGNFIKEEMAQHLGVNAMSNTCVMVLTWKNKKAALLNTLFAKKHISNVDVLAKKLLKVAHSAARAFNGKLLDRQAWGEFVTQCSYPKLFSNEGSVVRDNVFLYELWVKEKPILEEGCLKFGNHYIKTALMYLYPDADTLTTDIGFTRHLSDLKEVQTHLTHVLKRSDKHSAIKKSDKRTQNTRSFSSDKNQERTSSQLHDDSSFRAELEAGAEVYDNVFIISIASRDATYLNDVMAYLKGLVQGRRGELRYNDSSQLSYYRYSLPAQGAFVPWMREDTDSMVANLFPCQKFKQGDINNPMMLRQTHSGELVAKGFSRGTVNHAITVAATGGGKGVQKCAEILETFPLGIDWYIAEVGTSYQWTVEACGGTYLDIDPETTCINPLPPIEYVDIASGNGLDLDMQMGVVDSLSLLLLDNEQDLSVHEKAAAEEALNSLYKDESRTKQPLLSDLLLALKNESNFINDEQKASAKLMAANLESFLMSAAGKVFNQETSIHIHEGIFAVNLMPVFQKAEHLLKFYFMFIGLAYMQFAYASGKPSRVLLDEMHVLVNQAPKTAEKLISGIARMGRKDGAAIDLVTQETAEIDAIESAVINQTPNFNLLWRNAEWEHIAKRLYMPPSILHKWKNWHDPVSTNLNYRNCMSRILGDYYELKLSFPHSLMAISGTSEVDLVAKPFIGKLTQDVKTRIELLYQYRAHFTANDNLADDVNHANTRQYIQSLFLQDAA